jgi:hypothetical protein
MATIAGPYVPLNNLVLTLDPRNTKCWNQSGSSAVNQIDNSGVTLSSITLGSQNSFNNNAAGAIQTNSSYNLSLLAGCTVVQWLNLTSRAGGTFNYSSAPQNIFLYMGGGTAMQWSTYQTGGTLNSNTTVPLNTWHMWAATFSGAVTNGGSGTSNIYYNGILDNTGTVNGTVSQNAVFQVGIYSAPCQGNIGPTMFWNRALSAAEIRSVFQSHRSYYGI